MSDPAQLPTEPPQRNLEAVTMLRPVFIKQEIIATGEKSAEGRSANDRGQAGPSRQAEVNNPDVSINVENQSAAVMPIPTADWRSGKSLTETMEYILEHDEETRKDVTFILGPEKEEISAHKLILAMVSPDFDYMLYEAPLVKGVTRHIYLIMESVRPNIFRMLMRFIYTKKLDPDPEMTDAMELLKLAIRFTVPDLVSHCMTNLRTGITDQNAAEIFNEAVLNLPDEGRLRNHALAHILQHGESILNTNGFLQLSLESLCAILENDGLIAQELKVFQAAVRWAEHSIRKRQQNEDVKISGFDIRNELDRALFLIRFPLMMPSKQFTQHVVSRQILTAEEKLKILVFIVENQGEEQNDGDGNDVSPFSKVPRAQRTTVAEATSTSWSGGEDGRGEEPPRKMLKTDVNEPATFDSQAVEPSVPEPQESQQPPQEQPEEPIDEIMKRYYKHYIEPIEPMDIDEPVASTSSGIPGHSIWSTVTVRRPSFSSPDSSPVDLMINDDSNSMPGSSSSSSSSSNEGPEPSRSQSLRKIKPLSKKNESLLTEEEEIYYKENIPVTGNNLNNLFQRMIQMLDIIGTLEDVEEIREERPVVISPQSHRLFPLQFPCLRDFHVNFLKKSLSVDRFKDYLKNLNLDSLVFYKIFEEQDFGELWVREVNTTITVNGITVLQMDFRTKSVTISRIKQAARILDGLKNDETVRAVHLDEVEIDSLNLIPTKNLEILTLRAVTGIKDRPEFLKKCKKLKELSFPNFQSETIDLGKHLGFFEGTQLRRLAIGKAKIFCSKPVEPLDNSIEELYLDKCSWNQEFGESLALIFPKLKKVKICICPQLSPKILKQFLEIESIEYLCFWEMVFKAPSPRKGKGAVENAKIVEEMRRFIDEAFQRSGSTDRISIASATSNTFELEKVPINPDGLSMSQLTESQVATKHWQGRKISGPQYKCEEFNRLDYEHFDWSMFYKDYSVFRKMF